MLARVRRWALVYLLVLVAGTTWITRQRIASWDDEVWVALHPINGDGSTASAGYIASLTADAFAPMDRFFALEAARHGLELTRPVHVVLGQEVHAQPPLPPRTPSTLEIMLWSLRLRWWVWRVERGPDPPPAQVTVFVRYFDPATRPVLRHSLGLREGMIGVVNAFASPRQAGSNQVVIAHEVMHTLGATDRYDPTTNQPLWPEGFAEPLRDPRYPQSAAELMAGRIPVDAVTSVVPASLARVIMGDASAAEIGWRRD